VIHLGLVAKACYTCEDLFIGTSNSFDSSDSFARKAVGVQRGNAEVGADEVRPGIRRSNPTLRLWFRRTQQGELLSRARFR